MVWMKMRHNNMVQFVMLHTDIEETLNYSMPTVKKSLADISQRNLGTKSVTLTTATRSAEALAEEFSTNEKDTSWFTTFFFSSIFQLASETIVDPNAKHDLTLAHIREILAS